MGAWLGRAGSAACHEVLRAATFQEQRCTSSGVDELAPHAEASPRVLSPPMRWPIIVLRVLFERLAPAAVLETLPLTLAPDE